MEPAEFEIKMQAAIDAFARNDWVRALALTDQLAEIAPDVSGVFAIRAAALLATGSAKPALNDAQRAVRLDAANLLAHLLLADAAGRCGKLGLAQQSLERAIDLSKRDPTILAEYAWFMATNRAPRLAEDAAQAAIRANPKSAAAWAALGLAQNRMHQASLANESLKHALQLDPNDRRAQTANVLSLQSKGQTDRAKALASIMADDPANAPLVQFVHQAAKSGELQRKIIERVGVENLTPVVQVFGPWFWSELSAWALAIGLIGWGSPGWQMIALFASIALLRIWLFWWRDR